MDNRNKPILTSEQLDNNILVFINNEKKNMKVANCIMQQFIECGFKQIKVKQMFEGLLEPKDLSREEKIAFIMSAWEFFQNDEIKLNETYIKNLQPTLYFYDNVISEVRLMQPQKEEKLEKILFKNTMRLNEEEYQTVLKASELYNLKKQGMIVYYKPIQRATRIEILPDGTRVKKENYNKDTLKDMEKDYTHKNMLATQITLTIILFDGKIPNVEFYPEYHDCIGDFIFKPNFNSNADDYAFIGINDGGHRLSAIISSYINSGVDNVISVAIKVISEEKAKDLSAKSFMQASTDTIYRKTLENNPINKIVNTIIENTEIFDNTIAKTKQESKLDGMLANYLDIVELVKLLKIDTKNEIKSFVRAKQISNIINQIMELIKDNYNGSIDEVKQKSILLNKNSALMYIYVANELYGKTEEDVLNMSLNIIQLQNKIESILNLKTVKIIVEKFKELFVKEDVV